MSKIFRFVANTLAFSSVLSMGTILMMTLISNVLGLTGIDPLLSYQSYPLIFIMLTLSICLGLIAVYLYETRNLDRRFKFQRVVITTIRLKTNINLSLIREVIQNFGFADLDVIEEPFHFTINGVLPWGVYNLPKSAGGEKVYPTSCLEVTVNSSTNELTIKLKPKFSIIPTAFTYSNVYFLEKLEHSLNALQNTF